MLAEKYLSTSIGSIAEGGHAGANFIRRSISINTGFGDKRFLDGNIEELLIHEGTHVSLDLYHKNVSYMCAYIVYFTHIPRILF